MKLNLESIIKSFKRTLGISILGLGLTFFSQNANADIDKSVIILPFEDKSVMSENTEKFSEGIAELLARELDGYYTVNRNKDVIKIIDRDILDRDLNKIKHGSKYSGKFYSGNGKITKEHISWLNIRKNYYKRYLDVINKNIPEESYFTFNALHQDFIKKVFDFDNYLKNLNDLRKKEFGINDDITDPSSINAQYHIFVSDLNLGQSLPPCFGRFFIWKKINGEFKITGTWYPDEIYYLLTELNEKAINDEQELKRKCEDLANSFFLIEGIEYIQSNFYDKQAIISEADIGLKEVQLRDITNDDRANWAKNVSEVKEFLKNNNTSQEALMANMDIHILPFSYIRGWFEDKINGYELAQIKLDRLLIIYGDYSIINNKNLVINYRLITNNTTWDIEEVIGNLEQLLPIIEELGNSVKSIIKIEEHIARAEPLEEEIDRPTEIAQLETRVYSKEDKRTGVYEDGYEIVVTDPPPTQYYEKGETYPGVYRRDTPEGRKIRELKGGSPGLDYYNGPFNTSPEDFIVGILRVNVKDATTQRAISNARVYTESLVYLDFKSANTTNYEGNCMVAVADDTMWTNPDDFGSEYFGDKTLLRVTASGYKVFETVYEHTYFQMNDSWHNQKFNLEFEDWKFSKGPNGASIDITVNVYMKRVFIEVR